MVESSGLKITTYEQCAADLRASLGAWEEWLIYEKRVSGHTLRAYTADVAHFINFLAHHHGRAVAHRDLGDTAVSDFRAWLSRQAMEGRANTSRARALSGVKNLLRWLDRQGILHNAAISALKTPKRAHTLPRPLQVVQALRLINDMACKDWCDTRDKALFTLLYGAGLRVDEALDLNIADLPRPGQDEFIRVRGKGDKQRQAPVLPVVDQHLAVYRAECPYPETPERPVFLGKRGKRLNQGVAQRSMRHLRRATDLPETATPHALRHSYATHLLQNGANLREIQELLGHASLSTTQRYTELDAAKMLEIYKGAHPRERS
jgi:integrase/recombinase XerC